MKAARVCLLGCSEMRCGLTGKIYSSAVDLCSQKGQPTRWDTLKEYFYFVTSLKSECHEDVL